jgi:ubiquinone/menaquinone biosynthesis C-methylase UbiE
MNRPGYVFDNAAPQAEQRFTTLEQLYDEVTFRNLSAVGMGPGWHCLEVGAGGGSVARWLACRAGPAGHVLATDLNPRWMPPTDIPALEVRRHDIVCDPLPEAKFGLIHARLVLVHLPEREAVLRRLSAALRPGGWLVIEDFDMDLIRRPAVRGSHGADLFGKYWQAMMAVLASHGADAGYAQTLPWLLEDAGLQDVQAEGHLVVSRGGSPGAGLQRANLEQTRDELAATGLITHAEMGELCDVLADPRASYLQPVLVSARGRRPRKDNQRAAHSADHMERRR